MLKKDATSARLNCLWSRIIYLLLKSNKNRLVINDDFFSNEFNLKQTDIPILKNLLQKSLLVKQEDK